MEFASFYGLKTLLQDLGIVGNGPTKLYCDRNATINMAHNPVQHDWTKHIEIDQHFIKKKLNGLICMPFLKSRNQLANICTKGVMTKVFYPIVYKLGMQDNHAPWGWVLEYENI